MTFEISQEHRERESLIDSLETALLDIICFTRDKKIVKNLQTAHNRIAKEPFTKYCLKFMKENRKRSETIGNLLSWFVGSGGSQSAFRSICLTSPNK